MIYEWREGSHVRRVAPAQEVGERLEKLRKKHDGITAQTVVDDARPTDALLHGAFEWRNSIAAEEYRKAQARQLIASVVVQATDNTASQQTLAPRVRAFVVVNQNGEDSYTSVSVALSDPNLRQQVLARAKGELESWRSRYKDLSEFAEIFSVVDASLATA